MTTKTVKRYYCDHCKKGGCSKPTMAKHEARCIKNPLRYCGFCEKGELHPAPLPELVAELVAHGDIEALKKAADGCPACVLSAIVQSKVQRKPEDGDDGNWIQFDYKKEVAEFWKGMTNDIGF
jgi:hypothetical protein